MEPEINVTITLVDPMTDALRVDSNAPNFDMILNMLAQATRWAEDQRHQLMAMEHMRRIQDQKLADRLVRPS